MTKARQTSKEQTKMPRFVEGPRPYTDFSVIFAHALCTNTSYRSYHRFDMQTRRKGQFCIVLTLKPRLCASLNKGIFDSGLNSNNSYYVINTVFYWLIPQYGVLKQLFYCVLCTVKAKRIEQKQKELCRVS